MMSERVQKHRNRKVERERKRLEREQIARNIKEADDLIDENMNMKQN